VKDQEQLERLLIRVEKIAGMMQELDGNATYVPKVVGVLSLDDFISWSELKQEATEARLKLQSNAG
jgi:hypothetical protein